MARPAVLLKRVLIFVHRWLGVALSLLFLLWFASGIVMMYWTFPEVSPRDRLQRAPALDPANIALDAAAAFAAAGLDAPPGQVVLTTFDGRPVYRTAGFGGVSMVFADDGTVPPAVDEAMADRAAAAWAGRPAGDASKVSMDDIDQWTVGGDLRGIRPLYKYSFSDGQQVYVDGTTADVVQYTTTASRIWAYLGAIPHWLYFTPIRRHSQEWYSFVVWTSLIGTVSVIVGLLVAVWMYSPARRYRHRGVPTRIPYRGWKRQHAIIGLVFGLTTLTWTFSGLLSMGPFPIMDSLAEITVPAERDPAGDNRSTLRGGRGRATLNAALRGGDVSLSAYSTKHPRAALASVADFAAKEMEFTTFAGKPVYIARNGDSRTRVIPVEGEPVETFDAHEVMRIVRETAGEQLADVRLMEAYDAYYLDRRGERPLPVVYARMHDAAQSRYYIDPGTGQVVGSYNARQWVTRWLYQGLHSLSFPWLYQYRPLWDIVVITLMLGGTALCVTSVVMTWRVLARKVASVIHTQVGRPSDDLEVEGVEG